MIDEKIFFQKKLLIKFNIHLLKKKKTLQKVVIEGNYLNIKGHI